MLTTPSLLFLHNIYNCKISLLETLLSSVHSTAEAREIAKRVKLITNDGTIPIITSLKDLNSKLEGSFQINHSCCKFLRFIDEYESEDSADVDEGIDDDDTEDI